MSKLRSVLFYAELGSSKTNIALNTHFFKLTADSLGRGLFLSVNKRAYLLAVPYLRERNGILYPLRKGDYESGAAGRQTARINKSAH